MGPYEHYRAVERPMIEVVPMLQRSEIKNRAEDWTGKSSTALRRKLQNRLNKRASRKRQRQHPETTTTSSSTQIIQIHTPKDLSTTTAIKSLKRPTTPLRMCTPAHRQLLTRAADFSDYMRTPLPSDQKLLTLLHFNLVRALTRNVLLLGLDPATLHDDIESPFVMKHADANATIPPMAVDIASLPPMLQPTTLQRTVSHHPEIDALPFAPYRDNLIRAGCHIDDVELCKDILYGVDAAPEISLRALTSEPAAGTSGQKDDGSSPRACGRTGLIVWGDPWELASWEVEAGFARKYRRFLVGCEGLIESSNYWRAVRGERRLRLD